MIEVNSWTWLILIIITRYINHKNLRFLADSTWSYFHCSPVQHMAVTWCEVQVDVEVPRETLPVTVSRWRSTPGISTNYTILRCDPRSDNGPGRTLVLKLQETSTWSVWTRSDPSPGGVYSTKVLASPHHILYRPHIYGDSLVGDT